MLILTALVAGGTALFVLGPLLGWGGRPAFTSPQAAAADRRQAILNQRQEVLAGIKDLELEYAVGKLTQEDFERTRERMTREAIELYRRLDEDDVH